MKYSLSKLREAILARFVNNASGQKLGRTQVMKLFYFLQELKGVQLGYDFRLFTYGPFDSEVLSDLDTATSVGIVNEKTVLYGRGYVSEITPSPHAASVSEKLGTTSPDIAETADAVIREFGSFGAAELELRSTILFVDRELVQGGSTTTPKKLAERILQVKPHFSEEVILDRITEMKKNGWLQSFAGR
jgi:uncharacterized protein YwgA